MNLNPKVQIPEKIFFQVGEVCDLVGVQAHVLRFWEIEFPMLSPQRNRSGQRTYSRRDVEIALRIKELLYDELFTIAGAKKKLQTELREASRLKIVHPEMLNAIKAPSSTKTIEPFDIFSNQLSESNILYLTKIELSEELQEILAILIELDREKVIDENERVLLDELMQIYEKFLLIKSRALRIAVDSNLIEPLSQ